jgi:hypothetical protein
MTEKPYILIREGLEEALAITRGEAKPFREHNPKDVVLVPVLTEDEAAKRYGQA